MDKRPARTSTVWGLLLRVELLIVRSSAMVLPRIRLGMMRPQQRMLSAARDVYPRCLTCCASTKDLRCSSRDERDVKSSKNALAQSASRLHRRSTEGGAGGPAWLVHRLLVPFGRNRGPRSGVRRYLPSHPTTWSSRPATNEWVAKTIAHVLCTGSNPAWVGIGGRGGATCRRLMAPLSDYVGLVLEWRRWLG